MKAHFTGRGHRSSLARIAAIAGVAGVAFSLPSAAHAINLTWQGGVRDDWDTDWHWNGLYVNSNDESAYDVYFGSWGDYNGIVSSTNGKSPESLNFAGQSWTLNLSSLSTGLTATALYLNVHESSPVVNVNARYGISWGTPIDSKWCDLNVGTGSMLNLNASVYGRGSLNKYGGGTAVITSPINQIRGSVISGTNVFAGTLVTDNPINDYNVRGGATLAFNIPEDGGWGTRGDLTYVEDVYGAGSFVKKGGATLTMTGNLHHHGTTTVEGGRVVINSPELFTSEFQLYGGDLELRAASSHRTFANRIRGTRSFIKSGPYTLTLTGSNSNVGSVFVTEGRLVESYPMGQSYTISSGADLTVITGGDQYTNAAVTGSGTFIKTGAGDLERLGACTNTGGTTISAGRLVDYGQLHGNYSTAPGTGLVFRPTSADNVNYDGLITGGGEFWLEYGTLTRTADYGAARSSASVPHVFNGARLIELHPHGDYWLHSGVQSSASPDLEFAFAGEVWFGQEGFPTPDGIRGMISGRGNFVKSGTGNLFLTSGMTYSGRTTINAGTVYTLLPDGLPASTALTVNPGGSFATLGYSQTVGSLAGSGPVTLSGNVLTISGPANATYSGVISDGSVTKNGPGTQTFTGGNTYTGGTSVAGGRLIDAQPHGIYTLSNSANLEFANSFAYNVNDSNMISGFGNFTAGGTGGLFIDRPLTHTGVTTISGGASIVSGVNNALPIATELTVSSGGVFDTRGISGGNYAQTVASLSGGGSVISNATFTISQRNTATFSGVISGTGGLTKNRTGEQILSGQNTYTGDTLIPGGRLTLASSGALRFKVGANGASNKLTGSGALDLNGTLVLDLTTAATAPGSSWTLVNTATLEESYGTTFAVASTLGAFTKTGAKWTRAENGIIYEFAPITGVLTAAPLTGYALWAATNLGGQTADQDFNGDGVKNGIAYFLNSPGNTTLPAMTAGTITWTNGGNIPHTAYGTQFKVQTSSNLANWTDVTSTDPRLNNTAASVHYTLPTGAGRFFVRLAVSPE